MTNFCRLIETKRDNSLASDFIAENYDRLVKIAVTMKPQYKKFIDAESIINDLYLSMKRSELNNDGYDPDYVSDSGKYTGMKIPLEGFVLGRLKKLIKKSEEKLIEIQTDEGKEKVKMIMYENESESLSYLYNSSPELSDALNDIIEKESLSDSVEYVMTYTLGKEQLPIDITLLLLNYESIQTFNTGIIRKIKEFINKEENKNFKEALFDVINYASIDKEFVRGLMTRYSH